MKLHCKKRKESKKPYLTQKAATIQRRAAQKGTYWCSGDIRCKTLSSPGMLCLAVAKNKYITVFSFW